MAASADFAKLVPGFDFLQGLMKNAGSGLPSVGQWIAPTLDPVELEKRIEQLKTVQFWLEQNARLLGATIQALEVQRMTLSTLKSMNLPVADFAEAFKIKTPVAAPEPEPDIDAELEPEPEPAPAPAPRPAAKKPAPKTTAATPAAGVVDPMQWWGALTEQFSQLAANALKDGPVDAAKNAALSAAKTVADAVTQQAAGSRKVAPKKAAGTATRKRR
jgi:hypothetical protein